MIVVNSAAFMFYAVGRAGVSGPDARALAGLHPGRCRVPGLRVHDRRIDPAGLGRGGRGPAGGALRRLLVRAGRLFLLGVILSNIYWMATPDSVVFRPMGVLQRLALAFLAAAVLYKTLGPRARLIIAIALLALYWPLCLGALSRRGR